jgi:predicted PurR-regulated permease PerM
MKWERTLLRFKTDLIFFYAALVFSLAIVWPVLFPLALGITLAYVCEGPVDFLERKFHSGRPKVRWLSSFLVVLGITLVFAVPLVLFSITGIRQFISLINGEGK